MEMKPEEVDLKRVVGAILFAARQPMTVSAIRRILQETAETYGEETAALGPSKEAEIKKALETLQSDCTSGRPGFDLVETADGYRFQSDPAGGAWVRHMLDVGKPSRLSRPGLETLAIIAYRQPVSRSEIEGVRGVAVDHVIRMLMEMQLIKIVGRSELPGRPMLYGTTALFLEHFGLKDLKDLPGIAEMARMDALRSKLSAGGTTEKHAAAAGGEEAAPGTARSVPDQQAVAVVAKDQSPAADPVSEQRQAPVEGEPR